MVIQNVLSEDSDQTAQMCREIWIFAGCTCLKVCFLKLRLIFYTLPHNSGGVLLLHVGCPCVCLSACPSIHLLYICWYFCFQMIAWVNVNGFSPNLVCSLILWRSGFGLLMGKFHQFLTVICSWHVHYFHFKMITSKNQWIFTKLWFVHWYSGDLVWDRLWANFIYFWQLSASDTSVFWFLDDNLSKCQWIFTSLAMCIGIMEVSFGIANGQI